MLTFAHLWCFAFLPLPWLLRLALPAQQRHEVSVRVPFGSRLRKVLGQPGISPIKRTDWEGAILNSLIWLCVLTAVARPQWVEPPVVKEVPTRDLLLLVDLSGSMDQEDFQNSAGKKVARLDAVKEVLSEFLEKRKGDRVGLVVFGDAAYLQTPFTTDLKLALDLLAECEVGMAGPRTAFGDAIGLGVGLFDEDSDRSKTIIALTDGNDTKSHLPPVEAARVAAQRDITIYTVAIGDPTTVGEDKLDEQGLKDVASEAGGKYFFAADREHLAGIYDELNKIETNQIQTVSHRPRTDVYYLPLLAGLCLSILNKAWLARRGRRNHSSHQRHHHIRVNPVTGEMEVAA
ncbi:VWA domain-containing protein [Rhodopirellula sp. JC740]|uniref:VWA domain-containing protein n=1 Tax=Rhodopirellula halodulae TaxID=2894198 RepID=A0ABS8NMD0_9BACT|nr:VWA domain-containing protein [Rhodopirellula sp. JC740]MCC9643631.1 VWA domain-containing protein [Rhodopirellula sp. JC740]